MERQYNVGACVAYVDKFGVRRPALVTIWWMDVVAYKSPTNEPGCNVVFVTDDAKKEDSYGSQIERATSVVHKSMQPAPGNYWCWLDEV